MLSHASRSSLVCLSARRSSRSRTQVSTISRSLATESNGGADGSNPSNTNKGESINSDRSRGGYSGFRGNSSNTSGASRGTWKRSSDLSDAAESYQARPRREQSTQGQEGQRSYGQSSRGGYGGGRGGYSGRGGYQGNNSQGGYQGNNSQGGYQGGYRGNSQGGYQGGSQGGYRSNNQGGYQGNFQGRSTSQAAPGTSDVAGQKPAEFSRPQIPGFQRRAPGQTARGGMPQKNVGTRGAGAATESFADGPAKVIASDDVDIDVDIDSELPEGSTKERTKADSVAIKKQILAKHLMAKRKRAAPVGRGGGSLGVVGPRPGSVQKFEDDDTEGITKLPGFADRSSFLQKKKKTDEDEIDPDLMDDEAEEEERKRQAELADLFDEEKDKQLAGDNRRGVYKVDPSDPSGEDFELGGADMRQLRAIKRIAILQDAETAKLKDPDAEVDDMDEEQEQKEATAAEGLPSSVTANDNPFAKDWLPDGSEVQLPEEKELDRTFINNNQDGFISTPKQDLADMEDFSNLLEEFQEIDDAEKKTTTRYIFALDGLANFFDDLLFKHQRRAYQAARSRRKWQKFMAAVREKAEAAKPARLEKRLKRKEAAQKLQAEQLQGLRTGDWFYYTALKMWIRKADLLNPMVRSTIATILANATYDLKAKQQAVNTILKTVAYLRDPPKEDIAHADWVYSMPKRKPADPRESEHAFRVPDVDWNKLISDAERSISFDDMKEKYTFDSSPRATKPLLHETFKETSD